MLMQAHLLADLQWSRNQDDQVDAVVQLDDLLVFRHKVYKQQLVFQWGLMLDQMQGKELQQAQWSKLLRTLLLVHKFEYQLLEKDQYCKGNQDIVLAHLLAYVLVRGLVHELVYALDRELVRESKSNKYKNYIKFN